MQHCTVFQALQRKRHRCFGAYSLGGTHSRTCFIANNPRLCPDYPWDRKPEQAEIFYAEQLEDEDEDIPEENDDENADPNVPRSNKVALLERIHTRSRAVDMTSRKI